MRVESATTPRTLLIRAASEEPGVSKEGMMFLQAIVIQRCLST